MPKVRFSCSMCGAPFEWPRLPPASMTCPNCQKTFQPHIVASASTIDLLSPVGIAISGGGHRATLFGLGALLAAVDLGLNRRVVQISSVSGGSLLNGFVAQRCAFNEEYTESFDRVAAQLATVIVNRGVLTKTWIWTILLSPIAVCLTAIAILGHAPLPEVLLLGIVMGLSLAAFLLRGWIVEWLLHRRLLGKGEGLLRIGEMPKRAVEHVMCCTELSQGKPCYISTWDGGRLYLRTKDSPAWTARWGEWFDVPKLPLTSAVRASAAFPGIPPRRVSVRPKVRPVTTGSGGEVPACHRALYLSDGGVWGNLGTQALLEDDLFRGACQGPESSERPAILLVVNASSEVEPVRSWQFVIPGWAEFKALHRALLIQNENTVEPRVSGLREGLRRHVVEGTAGRAGNPKVIPIGLSDKPIDLFPIVGAGLWQPGPSSELVAWALRLGDMVSDAVWRGGDAELAMSTELRKVEVARPPETHANDADALIRRREDLQRVRAWRNLCGLAREVGLVPTTLDRIPRSTAMALIARGYALAVAALYIFGATGEKLPKNILTQERLEALVPM
jgi:hypothetical protein